MRKFIILLACLIACGQLYSQVSVNNDQSSPHSSAMFEIKSNNKGFLPPRMNWTQIQAIENPATGLVVFDEGIQALRLYTGSSWIILSQKDEGLLDPPGNFTTSTARTSASTISFATSIAIGPDKKVCVSIVYRDTLFIGNDTFGLNNDYHHLFAQFDESGNFLWGHSFLGLDVEVYDVSKDATGNIFVTGRFSNTIDLDFGPGTDLHSSPGIYSIYFAKYNSNGDFIWGRHLPATTGSHQPEIVIDESGNCFLTGVFAGTLDADPGPGVQNLVSAGSFDIFFAKYDMNGNWVWAKRIGGTAIDQEPSLLVLSGTIVLAGTFQGTADLDPSASAFNLVSAGMRDAFFARYDGAGSFLWAKRIGGTNDEINPLIATDPAGNILFAATFSGTLDIDPDAGILNLGSASGSVDFYIAKYSGAGVFNPSWYFKIGSLDYQSINDMRTDANGNVYITGIVLATADFDPGPGLVNLTSLGQGDGFLVKYSNSGTFVFGKTVGGTAYDGSSALAVHPEGKLIYATGSTESIPWLSFNSKRFYSLGFYLTRYEE